MQGRNDADPHLSGEVKRTVDAARMFRGSRDFFLAYELLGAFLRSTEVREGRAPSPIQAHATCAALALELALKARIVLDGGEPPTRGPGGHKYVLMFGLLKPAAQDDVASSLLFDGRPATASGLLLLLEEFEGTFKDWRYMHEHDALVLHEGNMVAVVRALYESIVRLRPDFGPWPGVIVDSNRPAPWHLSPR